MSGEWISPLNRSTAHINGTQKKVQEKTNYLLFRGTLFVLHKFLISINVGKKIYQSKTVVLFFSQKKYMYMSAK